MSDGNIFQLIKSGNLEGIKHLIAIEGVDVNLKVSLFIYCYFIIY